MARFGVREQIVLISSVPLLFLIALLAIGFQLRSLTEQSAELSGHVTETLSRANRVYDTINDMFAEIKDYQKSRSPATLRRYQASERAIPGELDAVRAAAGGEPGAQARAKRFTTDAAAVVSILDRIFVLEHASDTAAIAALSRRADVQKLGPEYLASKVAYDSSVRSDAFSRTVAARAKLERLSAALVLLTASGVVVSLALAIGFGLRTGRRLRQLVANAMLLARHEPTLPLKGDDEIAEVDRAYHEMSRDLEEAAALQHALLPQRVPEIPGLRLDSAYVPAATRGKVGGDWFDIFPINSNLLGISMGDVAGHGLSAASTMGMLRQTMRVAGRLEELPSRVMRQVNRSLCADDPGALATALFATLDLTTGLLRWSIGGHPPPIVLRPDRSVTFLESGGLILGVNAHEVFEDFSLQLDVGCALVLYTDGLVEVERDYFKGLSDLAEAVLAEYDESSESIADNIQRRVFSRAAPRDDSAVLFVGISSLGATAGEKQLVWSFDARDRTSAQRVKRAILWQLAGLAEKKPDLTAVELIYGELLANVARHTPGLATVMLEWSGDAPVLHVDDQGPPFHLVTNPPAGDLAESGRGFWLLSNYAERVSAQRLASTNRISVTLPVPTVENTIGAPQPPTAAKSRGLSYGAATVEVGPSSSQSHVT